MSFRDKASFGKRQEYRVIAELLARGFDVYKTLVDDQGIDCIIRFDEKRYADVQIKARSNQAATQHRFPGLTFTPRANFFYIFFFERTKDYWVIPTMDLERLCYKSRGKMDFALPKTDRLVEKKGLARYKNGKGFGLLMAFGRS